MTSEKLVADYVEQHRQRAEEFKQDQGRNPRLDIILSTDINGDIDGPSGNYVGRKEKAGEAVGIQVVLHRLAQVAIAPAIHRINRANQTDGAILQMPVLGATQPEEQQLCDMIRPEKDVDGLHQNSLHEAATPLAIFALLKSYDVDLETNDYRIALVGASGKVVGTPFARMCDKRGIDITQIDTKLGNAHMLRDIVRESDVVVTATGRAGLITADMLRDGMVIADAGVATPKISTDGRRIQQGDVHPSVFESGLDISVTPPTRSIGPGTVTMLMDNVLNAAEQAARNEAAA